MISEHVASEIRDITGIGNGVSVTLVASRLEIGRPALSNVVNANAKLSPRLAAKIEKEYGAQTFHLLERQLRMDFELAKKRGGL